MFNWLRQLWKPIETKQEECKHWGFEAARGDINQEHWRADSWVCTKCGKGWLRYNDMVIEMSEKTGISEDKLRKKKYDPFGSTHYEYED